MSVGKAERLIRQGYQLHRKGEVGAALKLYERVLKEHPYHPVPLHYAALATRQLADVAQDPVAGEKAMRLMWLSVETAERAYRASMQHIEAMPEGAERDRARRGANCEFASILFNYAKFQQDKGNLEAENGAKPFYELATKVDPEQGESWTNLGNVYGELGNRMRAEACWSTAMECARPTPESKFNLSMVSLMKGDWETGWRDYESRWDSITFLYNYGRHDLEAPRWDRLTFDSTVLLHGEQGAGDIVMVSRWIPAVAAIAKHVVLEVLEPLVPLYRLTFPECTVVARGDTLPAFDHHLPMMSLPFVFGATPSNLPEPVPFQLGLGSYLPKAGRIGVCWRGSPTHVNDRTRSMPFEALDPLFKIPGLTWQSLQYGEAPEPLEPLEATDYLDTARAIAKCELVISVDTSVAHLAGTLGVTTWVLLPYHAEWRWMQDRSDTPWYPSAELIRQHRAGDWNELIGRVHRALYRCAA